MLASKSDCILWTGSTRRDGYGRLPAAQERVYAHRAAYCAAHGLDLSAIDGVVIRHACDNPQCVNPAHLEPGTHADNRRDSVLRNRHARGETHGSAKLTADQIAAIRSEYGGRRGEVVALARRYGVSHAQMSYILRGQRWKCEAAA